MDEYIKREDALDAVLFALVGTGVQSRAIYAIREVPTADVVPKSEVDKWKEINEQLHKEMSERVIQERKIERNLAVLQIIGEILSRHTPDIDGFFTIHKTELAELKKKYTEEKE